ncbi:hypothetical protein [Kitasatospora sp. NPDC097643]|uniref:hypothetical protein n=1 Tax=Kitasatospora sp. NPDC097643 TaxID=3157230 RepID=UPI00331B4598
MTTDSAPTRRTWPKVLGAFLLPPVGVWFLYRSNRPKAVKTLCAVLLGTYCVIYLAAMFAPAKPAQTTPAAAAASPAMLTTGTTFPSDQAAMDAGYAYGKQHPGPASTATSNMCGNQSRAVVNGPVSGFSNSQQTAYSNGCDRGALGLNEDGSTPAPAPTPATPAPTTATAAATTAPTTEAPATGQPSAVAEASTPPQNTYTPTPVHTTPAPVHTTPAPVHTTQAPAPEPTVVAPQPPTVAAPQPPAACNPLTSSGNCFHKGEACPKAWRNQTGTDGSGSPITCEYNSDWAAKGSKNPWSWV